LAFSLKPPPPALLFDHAGVIVKAAATDLLIHVLVKN
jgi:hypothetical protein